MNETSPRSCTRHPSPWMSSVLEGTDGRTPPRLKRATFQSVRPSEDGGGKPTKLSKPWTTLGALGCVAMSEMLSPLKTPNSSLRRGGGRGGKERGQTEETQRRKSTSSCVVMICRREVDNSEVWRRTPVRPHACSTRWWHGSDAPQSVVYERDVVHRPLQREVPSVRPLLGFHPDDSTTLFSNQPIRPLVGLARRGYRGYLGLQPTPVSILCVICLDAPALVRDFARRVHCHHVGAPCSRSVGRGKRLGLPLEREPKHQKSKRPRAIHRYYIVKKRSIVSISRPRIPRRVLQLSLL